MAQSASRRLNISSLCASCQSRFGAPQALKSCSRSFSASTGTRANDGRSKDSTSDKDVDALVNFYNRKNKSRMYGQQASLASMVSPSGGRGPAFSGFNLAEEERHHHLHVYATKHNTHITLTKPDRNALISVAAGNLNFRKAARGSYDAAYQLAAWVMGRIQQEGHLREIDRLEVVLRGFGPGREAVTKVLLGSEGRNLRGRVVKVTDATRLKFGGTRSKNPRRL